MKSDEQKETDKPEESEDPPIVRLLCSVFAYSVSMGAGALSFAGIMSLLQTGVLFRPIAKYNLHHIGGFEPPHPPLDETGRHGRHGRHGRRGGRGVVFGGVCETQMTAPRIGCPCHGSGPSGSRTGPQFPRFPFLPHKIRGRLHIGAFPSQSSSASASRPSAQAGNAVPVPLADRHKIACSTPSGQASN
jgi:hypothetical protein